MFSLDHGSSFAVFPPPLLAAPPKQVLVPVLALGGNLNGHGIASWVYSSRNFSAAPVQAHPRPGTGRSASGGDFPAGSCPAAPGTTRTGNGVAPHLPVQGAEAHQVDGSLENCYMIQARVAGQAEGDVLIATSNISFEPRAIPVIGAALAGEHRSSRPVPPHKHAVVVFGVLVQQSCLDKSPDHPGARCPFFEDRQTRAADPCWGVAGQRERGLILLSVLAFGRHRL